MAAILKLCVPFLSVMTHNTGGMPPLLCLPMWASVHLPILRKVKFAYTYLAALTSLLEAGTLTDRLLSEKALWKRTDLKKCFTAWITTLSDFLGPNVPNNSLCYFVSFHVSPHHCWGLWAQMVLHLHCSPLQGDTYLSIFVYISLLHFWKPVKLYCPTFWWRFFLYLCFALAVRVDLALCSQEAHA